MSYIPTCRPLSLLMKSLAATQKEVNSSILQQARSKLPTLPGSSKTKNSEELGLTVTGERQTSRLLVRAV